MQWGAIAIARLLETYLALGLVFALAFALRGITVIDPATRRSSIGFRLLMIPGAVALWPLLLRRWRQAATGTLQNPVRPPGRPPRPARGALRRGRARALGALAVFAPLTFFTALAVRSPPASTPMLPAALLAPGTVPLPDPVRPIFESALVWKGLPIQTRVVVAKGRQFLELDPHVPIRAPSLLLYRSNQPGSGPDLPGDAQLLGHFGGSEIQHYELDSPTPASLWLFSVADGAVLGSGDLARAVR